MTARSALSASILALLLFSAAAIATAPPAHDIRVRIEPATHRLEGRDTLRFDAPRAATLLLSSRFRIDSLLVDGRRVQASKKTVQGFHRIALPAARRIEMRWSGTLAPIDRSLDHRQTLAYELPASAETGTFLPSGSGWYPMVDGSLESYVVELDLPAGQTGLVPGRLVTEDRKDGRYRARFEFREPGEGISLMAGPYRIEERRVRTAAGSEIRLRTYFHPEIADLAPGYLDSVAGYIELYERRIGAYPFSEFSVVSSPTPTGLGMPTLTYLGIDVLRLPFIRATSLGHEVLHNWWGNGVYPDYARGNWSEGLTNFMADYAYREREGPDAARAMRLAWLRDFAAMPPDDDTPLTRFTSRTHGASQIVGYNKSAMLFFMLRDAIGEDAFERGVREFWSSNRFRIASWDDLRRAFEQASGNELAPFFGQWLARSGAPEVRITSAKAERTPAGWRLDVALAQSATPYALSVPMIVRTSDGDVARRADLSRELETVTLDLPAEPLQITLDPDLRLLRRLAPAEAPPILREAMLAGAPALVIPTAEPAVVAAARALAASLLERAPAGRESASTQLVAGLHSDIDAWLAREGLPPRPATLAPGRGSAQVWTVRAGDGRILVLVSARDAPSLAALARPLPHYGRESYLVFEGARALERGTWPSQPQAWTLGKEHTVR
ncbi:MAG: M1 family aminopeptidase [Proteobacteria bacterium]|nr:M1 family aminopeptidase [Pseudomonadota bacterium]